MSTLFKKIDYSLAGLMESIAMGQIGLPDLQRPFVWPNKKVRDLFDSMYRGYPVGYLLLWETAANRTRAIGTQPRQAAAQYLVIDGQQRLTSLYAVLRGCAVKRQNFAEETIPIAFRPLDGSFEVADVAIYRDPTWIPDISRVWAKETSLFELVGGYLDHIAKAQTIDASTRRTVEEAIQRLAGLMNFPFTVLQLSASLSEEQVAEVFVRINSKGTPLNQADFILTLMSVFCDRQRNDLETFCQKARIPSTGQASPFNYFIEPDPDHLLRVAVALGFRRARLQHVYSILRGKDLETGKFSEQRREEQFDCLDRAQTYSLDLQHWHDFFKCLIQAGYRSAQVVTSRNAVLYTYAMYLIGKRDYRIKSQDLRRAIARWFYFVSLTGRYTASPESQMEQDLADLRDIVTAEGFLEWLERTIASTFTPDYWSITLPNELGTSSARSPGLFAYYAALNVLGAKVLFSEIRVSELMDPATRAKRAALERHHLFPKALLGRQGVYSRRETNQIANYALLEWPDNNMVADASPSEYYPLLVSRLCWTPEQEENMRWWHALPESWHAMDYQNFLATRRRLLAKIICAGFENLSTPKNIAETDRIAAASASQERSQMQLSISERVLQQLPRDVSEIVKELIEEPLVGNPQLRAEIVGRLAKLETLKEYYEGLDLNTARSVADRCLRLLGQMTDASVEPERRLVQAAVLYFLLDDDAEKDFHSHYGFDDDVAVVDAIEIVIAMRQASA